MILVTGATGNVGREILPLLQKQGARVRALVRKADAAARLRAAGIEVAIADTTVPASLAPALDGVERVYLVSPPNRRLPEMEANVVAAAKRAGVRHIVKHSALGATPHAACPLLRWNAQAERAVEDSGIAFTHLRPNGFMQNIGNYYGRSIARSGTIHAYGGAARVSLIDTRDVAAAAVAVLAGAGHEGLVYDLTGPEALSHDDVAARLSAQLEKAVRHVAVSEAAAWAAMTKAGLPPENAHGVLTLAHVYLTGAAAIVTGTVERLTGRPARRFDDYLADNLGAFSG